MTKQFHQSLNEIHKEIWEKSDENGEIEAQEIKNAIKITAGHTVVEKYWNELHNFKRIEQIPETQKWLVKEPEKAGIDTDNETGERRAKRVMIPTDILKAGEQYGINFSAVTTEALIEELSNKEQFIKDYTGNQYTEKETEYIFELLKNDLYAQKGNKKQMARRGKHRRTLYKNVFNTDSVKAEEREQIEKLRKQAFKLHEMLGM